MHRTIAVVVAALAGLAFAAPAGAVAGPVAPVRVVLSGPSVTVPLRVTVSGPTDARADWYGAVVSVPDGDPQVVARSYEGWSSAPDVPVTAGARSSSLRLGGQSWEVEDLGDGVVTRVPVTVLRGSRLAVGAPVRAPGGAVGVSVRVAHYDPVAGRWVAAPGSPVWVQASVSGRWVTVGTVVSDRSGLAVGSVRVSSGVRVRFVRPEGARDASVVSGVVTVR